MNMPPSKELLRRSAQSLRIAREPKKAILCYAGLSSLVSLSGVLITLLLDQKMANAGGLSNLGLRSVLSTVETILPFVQLFLLLGLEVGYLTAALRFARGQYANHTDVCRGLRLFWPMVRLTLLQTALYVLILLAVSNVASTLIVMTPLAQSLSESLAPILESGVLPEDPQALASMYLSLLPVILLSVVLFALAIAPVVYHYRMSHFYLVDHPRQGAIAALRGSRQMMRHNCVKLLRLDLRFWWYYLLSALAGALAYGDSIFSLLGILPDSTTSYLIFCTASLLAQFAVLYFFHNRVQTTYATAYETIRPQEDTSGITLGSIFDTH